MRIFVCLAAAVVIVAPALSALQAPSQSVESATFDVVSIKRVQPGAGMFARRTPGVYLASGVPVFQLIREAFQLQPFQIVGGPEWMRDDRFDIEARFDVAAGPTGPASIAARLRNMLRDRFSLAAHRESREMPVYALVHARTDGRLGPQIKPSAVECATAPGGGPAGGPAPGARGRGVPPLDGAPFSPGERPQCGARGGFGQMLAGGVTMAQFANQLGQLTGRIVTDETGLKGGYDFDMKWTPTPDQLPPGPPPPGIELPPIDPNGPSLFTALQEQLGLKLESRRAPVDVLVIDRLEQPAEN